MEKEHSFVHQLLDRKMVQVLVVYLGVAWGLAQVAEFVVDNYGLSRKFLDVTLLLLILGIPAAIVIAWFHGEKGAQKAVRSEVAILTTLLVLGAIGTYRISTAATPIDRALETALIDLGDESVAVLSFRNQVSDAEFDWLGDGVAELLSTQLAQIPSLKVVSRQRLFDLLRAEGQGEAEAISGGLATQITARAGARFMVDGQILGGPSGFLLTANLVDIETGQIAAAAEARGTDVFSLVDKISARLSSEILGALVETADLLSVASVTTGNLAAFREYQLGLEAERRLRTARAIEHLERAVALDSTFALAQLRLAAAAIQVGQISLGVNALQAARRNRDAAPERDRMFLDAMIAGMFENDDDKGTAILTDLVRRYPDDKEARTILASQYPLQSEERRTLLEETIQLDPGYASAYNQLAYWHARKKNFDVADSLISRYVELEPGEPNPLDSKGEILEQAGRLEAAREAYRAALEVEPTFTLSLDHLVRTYQLENRPEEARAELEAWVESEHAPTRIHALALTGDTYLFEGRFAEGLRSLKAGAELARETNTPEMEVQVLLTLIPALIAVHELDSLTAVAARIQELDPLSPIPPFAALAALGEQGSMSAFDALVGRIRVQIAASPSLAAFVPRIDAGLVREAEFYRGDYESAVAWGDSVKSRGGLPVVGNHTYVRALLETGQGEAALRAARNIGGQAWAAPFRSYYITFVKQHFYYEARAHEILGDTAAAISDYERVLEGWGDAVLELPQIADTQARLTSLRGQ
ncbi:MAG: hypothetical protein ABFS14_07515 [Gemmatimonadota bacterium]